MKRKYLFLILVFALTINCLFPPKINNDFGVVQAISSEDSISNKKDIVPVIYDELPSNDLKADATSNIAPFDTGTQKLMMGYSITPKTNSYNEIKNVSYNVANFQIKEGQSIYMWVYFPDNPLENWYTLSITFKNVTGDSISWKFTATNLSSMMKDVASYKYGWKLLELNFASGIKSAALNSSTDLYILAISYEILLNDISEYLGISGNIDFGEANYLTNGKLSLYHIFLGDSVSSVSSIVLNTDYCYYSIKSEFKNELNSLILKDTYTLKQLKEIFDYLYVGKTNLLLTSSQNSRFEVNYSITQDSIVYDRFPNEKFTFDKQGQASFTITLNENRKTRNITQMEVKQTELNIFKITHSMYISDYVFGTFNEGIYEIESSTKFALYFKVKDGFELNNAPSFKSTNEKIFKIDSIEYDSVSKRYILTVIGNKAGRADIEVVGYGSSEKRPTLSEYKSSATIEVQITSRGYSDLWSFLLMFLVICIVSSIFFAIFTIINIKKNKRMQKRQ